MIQAVNAVDHESSRRHVFPYTTKHPRRGIHHALQTIKSILRHTSREEAVAIVNPADCKTVDQGFGRVARKRLKRALDTSELVEAAVNNLNISTEYRRVTDRHLVIAVRATMHSNAQ